MHRIEQDQRATSEFFSHRAASDPALRKAGDESVFYIDVFTNLIAKEALIRGSGKFPLGSVILKRKSRTPDGKDTEYYTGMRKNGHGYWPEMGDWEFLVLDASGKEAEAGRLVSCSDCHARWAGADFVSRNYFDPCIPGGMKAVIRDEPDEQSR